NKEGDTLKFGFEAKGNHFFIDRGQSGKVDFAKNFDRQILAPRIKKSGNIQMEAYIDVSSLELFIDDGTVVLSSIFFPQQDLNTISIETKEELIIRNLKFTELKSIWNNIYKPKN
ncbi:MAG: GH32 C-terminal domain-containing protein, partial [Cyclobacteriaceae bacterium]